MKDMGMINSQNNALRFWLQKLASMICKGVSVRLNNYHTAFTDGRDTYIGVDGEAVQSEKTEKGKFYLTIGLLLHELAHVLYTPFKGRGAVADYGDVAKEILAKGTFPSTTYPSEPFDKEFFSKFRVLLASLYSEFSNSVCDGYIEQRMMLDYPYWKKEIMYMRNKWYVDSKTYAELKEASTPKNAMLATFILDYSLNHDAKICGAEDDFVRAFKTLTPYIDQALAENDGVKRIRLVNDAFCKMISIMDWTKPENNQQGNNGQSSEQQNSSENSSDNSQSQSNQNGSDNNQSDNKDSSQSQQSGENNEQQSSGSNADGSDSSDSGSESGSQGSSDSSNQENGSDSQSGQSGSDNSQSNGSDSNDQNGNSQSGNSSDSSDSADSSQGSSDGSSDSQNGQSNGSNQGSGSGQGQSSQASNGNNGTAHGNSTPMTDEEIKEQLSQILQSVANEQQSSGSGEERNVCNMNVQASSTPSTGSEELNAETMMQQIQEGNSTYFSELSKGNPEYRLKAVTDELASKLTLSLRRKLRDEKETYAKGLYVGKRLDTKRLYRADKRIMERKKYPDRPDMKVIELMDISGSIGSGETLLQERKIALSVKKTCEKLHIDWEGYAFNSSVAPMLTEDDILSVHTSGGTNDEMAFSYALRRMKKNKNFERRMIIVLTDGCGTGHARLAPMLKTCKTDKIGVIACGLGSAREEVERSWSGFGAKCLDCDSENIASELCSAIVKAYK